jgi:hypothetical protein
MRCAKTRRDAHECAGTNSYTAPYFGINKDSANPNDRRRTDKEHNEDNKVKTDDITTTININKVLDLKDISRGYRFPMTQM